MGARSGKRKTCTIGGGNVMSRYLDNGDRSEVSAGIATGRICTRCAVAPSAVLAVCSMDFVELPVKGLGAGSANKHALQEDLEETSMVRRPCRAEMTSVKTHRYAQDHSISKPPNYPNQTHQVVSLDCCADSL